MILLLYTIISASLRSRSYQRNALKTYSLYKEAFKPGIVSGVAWAIVRLVQFQVIPSPPELHGSSPSPLQTIISGIILGVSTAAFVVRYYDRFPTENSIIKSLIAAFIALTLIGGLLTLGHLSDADSYFVIGLVYNAPSYFVLGAVLGYTYDRLESVDRSKK